MTILSEEKGSWRSQAAKRSVAAILQKFVGDLMRIVYLPRLLMVS